MLPFLVEAEAFVRLPRSLQSLRNYNFRLFWLGQLISLIGTWVQSVGQAWLVLELTNSPLALGTVTALQFLPVLFLVLFAGVFVDRFPKRPLLLITQSASMFQALALAVLVSSGIVDLWHLYVLAIMLGMVNALDNPTRQAFVVEMVGREEVVNAVALNSALFNGARIVGPAIGGVLIATLGLAECFYVNAASFLAVIVGLLLMRENLLHRAPRRPSDHLLNQLAEGLRYAVGTPPVFVIVILMAFLGTFGYNFGATLPLLARDVLNVDASGFGALLSAMGIGSFLGALVVAGQQRSTIRQLFAGATGFAVGLAGLALSRSYPISLAILLPLGFSSIVFTTSANARLQLETPDALRGRVMSLYTLLFLGSTPIGSIVTGFLAEQLGVQLAIGIEAALCFLGLAAALAYYRSVVSRKPPAATSGPPSDHLGR